MLIKPAQRVPQAVQAGAARSAPSPGDPRPRGGRSAPPTLRAALTAEHHKNQRQINNRFSAPQQRTSRPPQTAEGQSLPLFFVWIFIKETMI